MNRIRMRIAVAVNSATMPTEARRALHDSIGKKLSDQERLLVAGDVYMLRIRGVIEAVLAFIVGLVCGSVWL